MNSQIYRSTFKVNSQSFFINTGKSAENIAVEYLQRKNFVIIERNWRIRCGEIDCIALAPNGETIVFVEVKCRALGSGFSVKGAVDYRKRFQVYDLANLYLHKNKKNLSTKSFRIDVIRISFIKKENIILGKLEHIEKAINHDFTVNFQYKKKIPRYSNR